MPEWTRELRRRLTALNLPPAREAEIVEELSQHLQDRYDELRRQGAGAAEAERAAFVELDAASGADLESALGRLERPRLPDAVAPGAPLRGRVFADLAADLRYALRMMRTSPGLAAVVIVTLALGIGANTALFSLVNALLLRPLPVAHPDEVASLFTSDYSGPRFGATSYPDYVDFRDHARAFSGLVAYGLTPLSLDAGGAAVRLFGETVSGNYFDVIGVAPALGRGFLPEEDQPSSGRAVVVIGDALWRRQFGGDPNAVGKSVSLNGQPFTIVGVAPPGYAGLTRGVRADLWVPLSMQPVAVPGSTALINRGSRSLFVVGRLARGTTVAGAQAELDVLARGQHAAYAEAWTDVRGKSRVVTLLPERDARVLPQVHGPVLVFVALSTTALALLLIVACANIANLLLARFVSRQREIALRLALGAGRGRLVRQLLAESLLLSTLAAGAGLVLARWSVDLLTSLEWPVPVPIVLDVPIDWRVLAFTLGAALLTGLFFGLAPAFMASRASLAGSLKDDGLASRAARRMPLRSVFVAGQVALSLLLLVGAGLFLRSLKHAAAIDPGFDARGVVVASLDLQLHGYNATTGPALYQQLFARLRALPDVEAASASTTLPLGFNSTRRGLTIEGYAPRPGEDVEVATATVGPDYFPAMRTAMVEGRGITDRDVAGAPRVVVVNQAFARQYFGGGNAIGRRVWVGGQPSAGDPAWEIVGVARDGKYGSLGEEARPFFFMPLLQFYRPAVDLVVRARVDPLAVLPSIRRELAAIDPALPLFDVRTLEQHAGLALLPARLAGWLLAVVGSVALALAALGLFGSMAYAVTARTREIGVRMALGADRRSIFGLVVGEGLRLTGIGGLVGVAAALLLTRLLSGLLYGVSPTDPSTFGAALVVLALVAVAACYVPARRAMRADPMIALRHD